jgi:hypothetical protein
MIALLIALAGVMVSVVAVIIGLYRMTRGG